MSKPVSGREVVKILCRDFGFVFVSQKGSHVKLQKRAGSRTITTIVPLHKELAPGTLLGILRLAEVDERMFRESR